MKIKPKCTLSMEFQMTLSEEEVGAIDALSGYNHDQFIKIFYEFLGKSYMQKYEKGLRSFLESARGIGAYIEKANKARESFNENQAK